MVSFLPKYFRSKINGTRARNDDDPVGQDSRSQRRSRFFSLLTGKKRRERTEDFQNARLRKNYQHARASIADQSDLPDLPSIPIYQTFEANSQRQSKSTAFSTEKVPEMWHSSSPRHDMVEFATSSHSRRISQVGRQQGVIRGKVPMSCGHDPAIELGRMYSSMLPDFDTMEGEVAGSTQARNCKRDSVLSSTQNPADNGAPWSPSSRRDHSHAFDADSYHYNTPTRSAPLRTRSKSLNETVRKPLTMTSGNINHKSHVRIHPVEWESIAAGTNSGSNDDSSSYDHSESGDPEADLQVRSSRHLEKEKTQGVWSSSIVSAVRASNGTGEKRHSSALQACANITADKVTEALVRCAKAVEKEQAEFRASLSRNGADPVTSIRGEMSAVGSETSKAQILLIMESYLAVLDGYHRGEGRHEGDDNEVIHLLEHWIGVLYNVYERMFGEGPTELLETNDQW